MARSVDSETGLCGINDQTLTQYVVDGEEQMKGEAVLGQLVIAVG